MPLRRFLVLCAALAPTLALFGADAPTTATRLINPLSLPDYPVGRLVRDLPRGPLNEPRSLWLVERAEQ